MCASRSALAARHVQSLSGADPYVMEPSPLSLSDDAFKVFAGDFNILPQSAAYRLLTSGTLLLLPEPQPPRLSILFRFYLPSFHINDLVVTRLTVFLLLFEFFTCPRPCYFIRR